MTNKTSFAIVANVSFALNSIISGAFNSYHKENLVKGADGKTGHVTPKGAAFFSSRPRLTMEEIAARLPNGYKLVSLPAGFQWAVNAQGAHTQAGRGEVGQSLFAHALASLTTAAAKAQSKTKPESKAKPAATMAKAKPPAARVQVKAK